MIKKYKGVEYLIHLSKEMGHFCGYVKLPDNHPYQKYINKKKKVFSMTLNIGYDKMNIDCHGGLTFFHKITKKIQNQKRFPQDFSLGSWIGWDYAHYGDYVPALPSFNKDDKKWAIEEVEKECRNVIRQLLKIK